MISKPNNEELTSSTEKEAQSPVEDFPVLKGAPNEPAAIVKEVKEEVVEEEQVKQVEVKKAEQEPETPEDDSNSAFIEIKKRVPRNKNKLENSSRPSSNRANGGFRGNGPRRNNAAPRNNTDSAIGNSPLPKRQNDTRTFDERFEEEKAKYLNRFKGFFKII